MVGPEQRVSKPARKSCRNVAATMGKRWRRTGGPEQQHYGDDWNFVVPRFLTDRIGRSARRRPYITTGALTDWSAIVNYFARSLSAFTAAAA
jgi:hypothetical protein